MSNGREFQRTDTATGNERRPTVDRRKDGTRSDCDDEDRSRRLLVLLVLNAFRDSRNNGNN